MQILKFTILLESSYTIHIVGDQFLCEYIILTNRVAAANREFNDCFVSWLLVRFYVLRCITSYCSYSIVKGTYLILVCSDNQFVQ
jgi:hypothetical protein